LVPLGELSGIVPDDLERLSDLLGKRRVPYCRLSFLSGLGLQPAAHELPPCRRHGSALFLYVVLCAERDRLCFLHHHFRRMALPCSAIAERVSRRLACDAL